MIRKNWLYQLATILWGVLVAASAILVYTGNAEPYVSASQAPGGGPVMFGAALVCWLAGAFVVDRVRTRDWKSSGRAAGLRPDGGLLPVGTPDLVGEIDGRTVRARTRKKKTGGGAEGGSSKSTFTVVEADLPAPADVGFFVRAGPGDLDGAGPDALAQLPTELATIDGDITVVGVDEAFARDALDRRSRDALRALGDSDGVLVGDVGGMVGDAAGEVADSGASGLLTGALAGRLADRMAGDAATVSMETKGLVLDADRLATRTEAVAALADSFEASTADR